MAVPNHADYDNWRDYTDEVMDIAEHILADRETYGIHLDNMARRGEDLASALSRVRETLRRDDRHIAETLVRQRKGEAVRTREERVARLLDDPGKLRELRKQHAKRSTGKHQHRGRHWGMRM